MWEQAARKRDLQGRLYGWFALLLIVMTNMNKRLTRPRNGRMIGGVCAGIGEYLGLDPTVVRIIYVLLSIGAIGTPIVIYLILCSIIPES